ncbi:hypothetical protein HPB51_016804 [Rhipicephalus microplus]|uniref:HAP1 N-terminal domain-containing protein n=1 Tax=Rhipicephalus microplus TaxID=6941 RepID=A0A9J6DHN5_RHIMP|nr:hypothetical protein HPB51_016804 [Rhipicephalus microplus]
MDAEVVSGERVSQMTRTYSDPEALTRLLEEKERDLELAAHIGQGLLHEKRELACRTDALEAELLQAQESLTQLRHELALKASLLQVYTAQEEADAALPLPTDDDDVPVSTLTRKIHELEEENCKLKAEVRLEALPETGALLGLNTPEETSIVCLVGLLGV